MQQSNNINLKENFKLARTMKKSDSSTKILDFFLSPYVTHYILYAYLVTKWQLSALLDAQNPKKAQGKKNWNGKMKNKKCGVLEDDGRHGWWRDSCHLFKIQILGRWQTSWLMTGFP